MTWKNKIICYLSAQTISQFGSSLVQYALIWKITLDTSSGLALAISTLCGFLPQFLISPFAGVLADRKNRKMLLIASDALIALATLWLLVMALWQGANIGMFYVVLAIRSLGSGIQGPASQTAIVDIVPDNALQKVHGFNASLNSVSMLLAPALSAWLLAFFSFQFVLSIDLVTALIGISMMFAIALPQNNTGHTVTYFKDIQEGLQYLKTQPWLAKLLLYQAMLMLSISPTAFMTPLCVSRVFGNELWYLSVAEITYSLGMVIGGIVIAYLSGFQDKFKTTFLAGAFYGFCMVGLGSFKTLSLFYLANTLIGISSPCYNAPLYTGLQERVDKVLLGRIFSVLGMVNSLAMPLGMQMFGPLADLIPVGYVFVGCGIVVLLLSSYMFFVNPCTTKQLQVIS